MPKIIENPQARLIAEAKRQIEENGYGNMTIRSVAAGCGVGVGTVYNYFPSKDDLLATCLLEDWNACMAVIREQSENACSPEPVARCIFRQLLSFARLHQAIFRDPAAAAGFAGSFSRYHTVLRAQLAQPLRKFCSGDFPAEFAAEALLTWSMAGKSFDEIYGLIAGIF